MNRLFFAILLLFITYATSKGQKQLVITGVLIDSAKQNNFINTATISLYNASDTTLVKYTLSDVKGNFKFSNIQAGINYKIVITAWQFKTAKIDFSSNADSLRVTLGNILMAPKNNKLQEVVVVGEIPPIIVRNDTIEFNAASFKTLPTAFVEDLFKKLPGFTLSPNGDVLVNGRQVSKILVDGREFFGGDKQIATKQLPANIVDKVIVVDDDLEKRRNPDIGKASFPLVINLTLKKGIKKGAFGKVYLGNAFEEKYEVGGIVNVFRDTIQVSVLGYNNNINRSGFTISDISRIGGFSRSGYRNTVMGDNGSFSLDNISFGGGDSGLQNSAGAGVNFNTVINGAIKFNAKYYYGRSKIKLDQSVSENQSIGQDRLVSTSNSIIKNNANYHNLGGKIVAPLGKLAKIYIEPSVIISPVHYLNNSEKTSVTGTNQPINFANNSTNTIGSNNQYSLSVDLDKSFKNPRRALFVSMIGNIGSRIDNNFNTSNSFFYSGNTTAIIDQLRDNNLKTSSIYLSSSYSEPLGKTTSLGTSFNATYQDNENALMTYYKNPINQEYEFLVPNFSETVLTKGLKLNARARLRWTVNKDLSIQPSILMSLIGLDNSFTSYPVVKQRYKFFSPALTLRYKIFTFEYTPTIIEPDIRFIQPILNNTDPLFIQTGNANLKPTKAYPVFLRITNYNQKTNFNYNLFANASIKKGSTIMSRRVTNSGVQINTPISVNDVYDVSSGGGFGKGFKGKSLDLNLSGGFNAGYNRNFVEVNLIRSESKNFSATPNLGVRLGYQNKIDLNQSYSLSFNYTIYTDNYFMRQRYITQRSRTDLTVRCIKNLVFDSQLDILLSNQNIAGYKNDITVWNLGMTYLFAKNQSAQLKFSANDLLQSNVKRNILITENSIRNTQTNSLGRFLMITLSYNIQSFSSNAKKTTLLSQ